tara:strand:+ start:227 stop:538 length:312 start_codon:yes stop_codon:yes gene_type:complete
MAETTTGFDSIPDKFIVSRVSDHWNYFHEVPDNPLPYPLSDEAEIMSVRDSYGDIHRSWTINIKSIEDLKQISDLTGHKIVISFNMERWYGLPTIEIYDDWRE